MSSWWKVLFRGLAELLSPGCCHLCGQHIPQLEQVFCPSCRQELLADSFHTCPQCAASVGPYTDVSKGCVICRKEKFPFKQALRLGPYQGALRDLVLKMKRPSWEFLALLITRLWLERDRSR